MKVPVLAASVFAAIAALPAFAQLATPNEVGVAMGHMHLLVKDIDAQKQFYGLLGGVPVKNGPLEFIQFPGVLIMMRKGEPSAGSVGSRVNHYGFHVKSVADMLAKLKPMNLTVEQNNPQQAFVTSPDGVRVELLEDATQTVPIQMHHIHIFIADTKAAQEWYDKLYGATPGHRATFDTSNMPGVEMAFNKTDDPETPTKGRSIDHIGFDVKSLDDFQKRLESIGLKFDGPFRSIPNSKTRVAFFTDPWGTYTEITENLAPVN